MISLPLKYDYSSEMQDSVWSMNNSRPQINDNSHIVWAQYAGYPYPGYNDSRIILYDHGVIKQVCDNYHNSRVNINPQINNNEVIVWQGKTNVSPLPNNYNIYASIPGYTYNVIIAGNAFDGGTNEDPQINDNGQIVWWGDRFGDSPDYEIYLYNVNTKEYLNISNNTIDDKYPQINKDGGIVWQGYDGQDWEIFFYSPGNNTTYQITNNQLNDEYPQINDLNQIVWTRTEANGSPRIYYSLPVTANYFSFTYYYGNGDSYSGTVMANSNYGYYQGWKSQPQLNETGNLGCYEITGTSSSYWIVSGNVYVNSYTDGDMSNGSYTPLNNGYALGNNYLGSELGYIIKTNVEAYKFGQGTYEADAGNTFNFTFTYANNDSYSGYVYASPTHGYYPGWQSALVETEAGYGSYKITGMSYTPRVPTGLVYVSSYMDTDSSGRTYTPLKYAAGQCASTDYLGSEYDYIISNASSSYLFGNRESVLYYEADASAGSRRRKKVVPPPPPRP